MQTAGVSKSSIRSVSLYPWRFLGTAAGIVLTASLLRIYRIGAQPLWIDEAYSWYVATVPSWLKYALVDSNPPLYYVQLRAWTALVGESEASLRLLSAGFGILFVAIIIWAGQMIFNQGVGLWAGLFATVAPMHVYYSQEARGYTLLMLALLLTYTVLWRAFKVNTRKGWAAVTGCMLISLYSHYFAILALVPTAFLLLVWPDRRRWIRYAGASLLALLLFIPWLGLHIVFSSKAFGEGSGAAWIPDVWQRTPPLMAIPRSLEILALGSQAGLLPIQLKQFSEIEFPIGLRLLGMVALVLLGIWVVTPWGDKALGVPWLGKKKAFLVTLLFFPLLVLWVISFRKPMYVAGRFDMVIFPAYVLLLGLGFGKLQRLKTAGPLLAPLIFLVLLIPIGTKLLLYYQGTPSIPAPSKDPGKTAKALHDVVANRDVVIFTGLRGITVLYYMSRLGYRWEDGYCSNEVIGRRFACRMFPRETEKSLAAFMPERVLRSAAAVREDVEDFLRMMDSEQRTLWVVFGPRPAVDTLLIEELNRSGFTSRHVDQSLLLVEFRRS